MLSYGLKYEDVAYVSSRNKTGWYKPADVMPAQLNNYVVQQNKQDLRLWELANARLDGVTRLHERLDLDVLDPAHRQLRAE